MNNENKDTTNNLNNPNLNLQGFKNVAPYQQYRLDAQKTFYRSFIVVFVSWTILSMLTYISWGVFLFFSWALFFLACGCGFAFYIVANIVLSCKYNLPNVYTINTPLSLPSNNFHHTTNLRFSGDHFKDNNPTYPGTSAWHARKMRE